MAPFCVAHVLHPTSGRCATSQTRRNPTAKWCSRSGHGGNPCQSGEVAGCPHHFGRGRRDVEVLRQAESRAQERPVSERQWHKPERHLLLRSSFKNNRKFFSQTGNGVGRTSRRGKSHSFTVQGGSATRRSGGHGVAAVVRHHPWPSAGVGQGAGQSQGLAMMDEDGDHMVAGLPQKRSKLAPCTPLAITSGHAQDLGTPSR